jgi:hypothetical protein
MEETFFLVQATMHTGLDLTGTAHTHEYTHYICRQRHNAERLALVLTQKRPDLLPVRVVEWQLDPKRLTRGVRFADDCEGPR